LTSTSLEAQCPSLFVRGDVNSDGQVNVTDPVRLLTELFRGGDDGIACPDASDTNDDGELNVTDGIFLLEYLFTGDAVLPAPVGVCGVDPTDDDLDCGAFRLCTSVNRTDGDCDGIDDDCDGEIDEDLDFENDPRNCGECGNVCALHEAPNVRFFTCRGGECVIAECEPGYFDVDGNIDNGCESDMRPEDECDDGNPCTTDDRILLGLCGGTPRDCSHLADPCNYGVCDGETGECIKVPRPGRACNDGDPSTGSDRCSETGECVGTPIR